MMTNIPSTQTPTVLPVGSDAVKNILKGELKRRGLTYAQLVERLASQGVVETEANLRNKISRGSFTAAFFIQCLNAIGCEVVQIKINRTPTAD